ncbi:MAG: TrkH family potassium uptake protein [Tepidimonas ignava]|uniref:Trk system potassium uptake protein n=1 Tax=Tepidimonas ignava TaxID=114249 RepID=A0A4R3LEF8_9BURK|nr:potassium transporter TrkG [Tepidimonas ignava]MCX7814155.1 TrkH family potassium uptake protein [Tepidimonas ignava]TCS97810.1 trk system potassium uptake protein TrkH [Tepidimonas ignava]TSE23672.1 Trk system potassium uptake protein TrkH [Tepidimonas ignava]
MPFVRIAPIFGVIVMVFALTMLVPLAVALGMNDGTAELWGGPLLGAFAAGGVLWWTGQRMVGREPDLQPRDGMLLVSLAWTVLPAIATVPLLLFYHRHGGSLTFTQAYFETVSAMTTTGATVLVGLDALPPSINLWRGLLQWLGGMGILVLAVAILPMLGVGGQLLRAESTGPMKDTRLTPRIEETAKGLWSVYAGISLACVLAYRWGGMSWLDAWIHMFTTMSLGGMSSHDASFAHFDSPRLEWTATLFMLVASGSFALYFAALVKRSPARIWRDAEWRGTWLLMLGSVLFIAWLLVQRGAVPQWSEALRLAAFNVVSAASTTGYATTDYLQWPVFAPIWMLLLSGVATSAGSTGAGIKMVRLLILLKLVRRELARIIHPRIVNPVTLGGRPVDAQVVYAVLAFMLVYGGTIAVLTMALLLTDMPFDTALSAVVASVNNLGPGLGEVGPAGNYAGLAPVQLWLCTLAMLMGRLEMLALLVLFTPGYWRK